MHIDGSPAFQPTGPSASALEFSVPGWEGMMVKGYISSWRFYRLLPALMKQSNAAVSQQFLMENGDNFSSWFMTLQTNYPDEFRRIKQVAKDVFPWIRGSAYTSQLNLLPLIWFQEKTSQKRCFYLAYVRRGNRIFGMAISDFLTLWFTIILY